MVRSNAHRLKQQINEVLQIIEHGNLTPKRQCDGKGRRRAFEEYEAACRLASARNNRQVRAYTAPEQVKNIDKTCYRSKMRVTKIWVFLFVSEECVCCGQRFGTMTDRKTHTLAALLHISDTMCARKRETKPQTKGNA